MTLQKQFLPIVYGKKGTPQFLSQNSKICQLFPHDATHTYSKKIKAFSSLSGNFHSLPFFTLWALASVHC